MMAFEERRRSSTKKTADCPSERRRKESTAHCADYAFLLLPNAVTQALRIGRLRAR